MGGKFIVMKKLIVILMLSFVGSIGAQLGGIGLIGKPDSDADFKVDASEMRRWSGEVNYYFSRGYSTSYFGVKLKGFVESFDGNKDGKFSTLEFRRFQSGAKMLFSDALEVILLKYDENKNKRFDKEEKEAARVEITNFLDYSLSIGSLKENGEKAEAIINKDRAIDDIYD